MKNILKSRRYSAEELRDHILQRSTLVWFLVLVPDFSFLLTHTLGVSSENSSDWVPAQSATWKIWTQFSVPSCTPEPVSATVGIWWWVGGEPIDGLSQLLYLSNKLSSKHLTFRGVHPTMLWTAWVSYKACRRNCTATSRILQRGFMWPKGDWAMCL